MPVAPSPFQVTDGPSGLTEEQARARNRQIRTVEYGTGNFAGPYTRGNGIKGTSKLVIDETRGVVIGATFTGPDVQELHHSATVAMLGEVPFATCGTRFPAFPS